MKYVETGLMLAKQATFFDSTSKKVNPPCLGWTGGLVGKKNALDIFRPYGRFFHMSGKGHRVPDMAGQF